MVKLKRPSKYCSASKKLTKVLTGLLLLIIKFYQKFLSPIMGRSCRFYPTCSEYSKLAIQKYGPYKGTLKSIYRILRCNPWNNNCGQDQP